jgi:hypothetical protein
VSSQVRRRRVRCLSSLRRDTRLQNTVIELGRQLSPMATARASLGGEYSELSQIGRGGQWRMVPLKGTYGRRTPIWCRDRAMV